MSSRFLLCAAAIAALVSVSLDAKAQVHSDKCSSSSACFDASNSKAEGGAAIQADCNVLDKQCIESTNHGNGSTIMAVADVDTGIEGLSKGVGSGVYGVNSGTGVGGAFSSNSSNGVFAQTFSATQAAVSAISPGSSDVAYWGTGSMQLTGSIQVGVVWNGKGTTKPREGMALKPGSGTWAMESDARVEKDVQDFRTGLAEVMRVRPVRFKYNGLGGTNDDGVEYVGVVAQELAGVMPSMVTPMKAKLHQGDDKRADIEVVDPNAFTYMLLNAVKEQQNTIERQEARIARLEAGRSSVASSAPGGAWLGLSLLPLGLVFGSRVRRGRAS